MPDRVLPNTTFQFGGAMLGAMKLGFIGTDDVSRTATEMASVYATDYRCPPALKDDWLSFADTVVGIARAQAEGEVPAEATDDFAVALLNAFAWHVENTRSDGSPLPLWRKVFNGTHFQPDDPYNLTSSVARFVSFTLMVTVRGIQIPNDYWFGSKRRRE